MTLKELGIGQSAIIETVGGTGALRQHFLDMGVIPGAEVTVLKYAPLGDGHYFDLCACRESEQRQDYPF